MGHRAMGCVQRYAPEFEKRWRRFARAAGQSWRVDETYFKIQGERCYPYDLCRRVEAHRLGVQRAAAEHVAMMAGPPRPGLGDPRAGDGMHPRPPYRPPL